MEIKDNLARQITPQAQEQPEQQQPEQQQPNTETKTIHKRNTKRQGLTRLEIGIVTFFSVILFGLLVANISLAMQVSTTNRAVQDLNRTSIQTEIENENLEQNVQELSRYDRVYRIAEEHGLEMNEENIRNVIP